MSGGLVAAEGITGPAQLVLTASVARRYYLDGKSKIEIADEFKLSRFKVARLLDDARASGLVRIEIGRPGTIDLGLSGQLREAYGLLHAIVVDTVEDDPLALRQVVGSAGAELLSEISSRNDVLGLGWARALIAMRAALGQLAAQSVVQLTGALSRPDVDDSSIELVRDVARIANCPAYRFYAPLIVHDAPTAAALRSHPEVARAISMFPRVTKAVVAVGGWDPPASTVFDAIAPSERKSLLRLGVHADVSGVLLDADGAAVRAPLTERMVCIDAAALHRIPEVIALVYGPEKAWATRAAIRGSYVKGVVTHTTMAEALLSIV
jgi:DNA-binding transcriptional regulator LsrR (DeoR family)